MTTAWEKNVNGNGRIRRGAEKNFGIVLSLRRTSTFLGAVLMMEVVTQVNA